VTRVDPDERLLIARCNRGEQAAVAEVYRRHRGWVLALARRMTREEAEALDLMQETFLDLLGRFPGFRLSSSLRAYLYPAIRHRAIDLARRRQWLESAEGCPEPSVTWRPPDTALGGLVERLPDAQREVVLLRFALDFQLDEIAEAQGVPLGTVKSRLHHALRTLKGQVEPEG
jgi:RNA polymerase sigma-70 factor (ECF subfamily)